eukprot:3299158-Rhodomonas_salina.2
MAERARREIGVRTCLLCGILCSHPRMPTRKRTFSKQTATHHTPRQYRGFRSVCIGSQAVVLPALRVDPYNPFQQIVFVRVSAGSSILDISTEHSIAKAQQDRLRQYQTPWQKHSSIGYASTRHSIANA